MEANLHETAKLLSETHVDLAKQGQTCADHGLEMLRGGLPEDCPVAKEGGSYEKCPRLNDILSDRRAITDRLAELSCNFD